MKTKILFALVFVALACLASATAQVRKTQQPERHRIAQGVKSGELTRRETRGLVAQQRNIRHDKRAARADGVVTPRERKQIKKEERNASRNIFRKKHNIRDRN